CVFGISHFGLYYLYSSTKDNPVIFIQISGCRCPIQLLLFEVQMIVDKITTRIYLIKCRFTVLTLSAFVTAVLTCS
ncbi:MAG: hypothetical protein ACLRMH_10285, partial [Lachnospiraceae bacterium]